MCFERGWDTRTKVFSPDNSVQSLTRDTCFLVFTASFPLTVLLALDLSLHAKPHQNQTLGTKAHGMLVNLYEARSVLYVKNHRSYESLPGTFPVPIYLIFRSILLYLPNNRSKRYINPTFVCVCEDPPCTVAQT